MWNGNIPLQLKPKDTANCRTLAHSESLFSILWCFLLPGKVFCQHQDSQQQQQQQGTNKNCNPVTTYLLPLSLQGVETKTAALSLFFDHPKTTSQQVLLPDVVVVVVLVVEVTI